MINSSSFKTQIFTAVSAPIDLKRQYGQLRYPCFSNSDPFVNQDHIEKTEFDRFDQCESTIYIMVTQADALTGTERLISAVRLMSTANDYDLAAPSWGYLTDGIALPKTSDTFDGSRWVGRSSRTLEGMASTGLLVMAIVNVAKERGFKQLIGATNALAAEWFASRDVDIEILSEPYYSERDNAYLIVATYPVDDELYQAGLELFNLAFEHGLAESNIEHSTAA